MALGLALSGSVQAQEAAPAQPTGLVAMPGENQVTLSWDDPSATSITGYEYQVRKNGGAFTAWTPIPDSSASGLNRLSYTISSLDNGAEYTFVIRANNGQGASDQSSSATATPLPKPAAPVGLEAAARNGKVWLYWNRSTDASITGYQYWIRKGTGTPEWRDIPRSSATTWTHLVENLDNGSSYRFRVKAVNVAGDGAQTRPVSGTPRSTIADRPIPPQGLSAEGGPQSRQITLTWWDPSDANIVGYQYRLFSTDTWKAVLGSGPSTTSYTISNLEIGGTYAVRIRSAGLYYSFESAAVLAEPLNTPPSFPGDAVERTMAENTASGQPIDATVVATDAENDTLTYSLSGTDAGSFDFDASKGQLQTKAALDYETKSSYEVVVSVHDGKDDDGNPDTITVTNEEEEGTLTLSSASPVEGTALTASLSDPDGSVSGITWVWERSSDNTTWTAISGATSENYTPVTGDVGFYLRATASYTDGHGPNKSSQSPTTNAVAAASVANTAPFFPSSPSEDYLAVLAGQRQWIATTNFAGCPSRPPDSFANSAVFTTSAKFLMRWAGPSARAFLCRLTPKRNSLSRLWPVQISDHSPLTFSSPRSRNCRNPRPCLIWPNTGSTVCIRKA